MAKKSTKNSHIRKLFTGKNIFVALGIGALILTSSLGYVLYNQTTDTAKAANTSYSNGTITLDKKYVIGGTEYDTLNAAQGSTVTVRLKYANTGTTAVSNASIKDSLPAGFTYVTNSFKNCLVPTPSELSCDTLSATNKNTAFTTLTSTNGISPVAGLYDAASTSANGGTAVTANSGFLEVGKLRYLRTAITGSFDLDICDIVAVNDPNLVMMGSNCGGVSSTDKLNEFKMDGTVAQRPRTAANYVTTDLFNTRYIKTGIVGSADLDSCDIFSTNDTNFVITSGNCGGVSSTDKLNEFKMDGTVAQRPRTAANYNTVDLLGKTIVKTGIVGSADLDSCDIFSTNDTNFVITSGNCGGVSSTDKLNEFKMDGTVAQRPRTAANYNNVNLVDQFRSAGYIEYKMTAPSFSGVTDQKYSTAATLSGTGITPLSDGTTGNGSTIGDITVSGTPKPSGDINKQYSVDGTNWCDKLDGSSVNCPKVTTTTPIKVRLNYENTGNLSAQSASIKDSLPSGFSYTTGSFKNCLVPTIAELTCDTLNTTNKDSAFSTLTSANGISPVAGLYDGASTSANGGTAPTANSGVLEIGKKRFLYNQFCKLNSTTTTNYWYPIFGTTPSIGNSSTAPAMNCQDPSVGLTNGTSTSGTLTSYSTDTLGQRFLYNQFCKLNSTTTTNYWYPIFGTTPSIGNSSTAPAMNCQDPSVGLTNGTSTSGTLTSYSTDTLGQRFLYNQFCKLNSTTTTNYWYPIFGTTPSIGNSSTAPAMNCQDPSVGLTNGTSTSGTLTSYSTDLLDNTRSAGYIEYSMTAQTATAGNYGTNSTLTATDTGFPTGLNSGTNNDIVLTTPLTTSDIAALTVNCNPALINSTTSCTFTLPNNRTLPTDFKLGIGNGALSPACTVTNVTVVTCSNVPTGSQAGNQTIYGQIGSGTKTDTGEKVAISSPLTNSDIPGLTITCNGGQGVLVGTTTTCTFTLPDYKTLPTDFKLGIGNANPAGTCSLGANSLVTCTNVPTGSQVGNQPIYAQIGSGTKVDSGEKAIVITLQVIRSGGNYIISIVGVSLMGIFVTGLYYFSRNRKLKVQVK